MTEKAIFEQDEQATDEKIEAPRRRRRRRKKQEIESEKQVEQSQFAEQIGSASAELANQVITHLPSKFFERRELANEEREGIKQSVSSIVSAVDSEQAQKLAKSFPYIVLGGISLIILLSRLKRRERTDTDIRESRIGQDNSREETRKETVEEKELQADNHLRSQS